MSVHRRTGIRHRAVLTCIFTMPSVSISSCSARATAAQTRTHAAQTAARYCSRSPANAAEPVAPREQQLSRRALLACASSLPALAALQLSPPSSAAAEAFATLRDPILAYEFDYPLLSAAGRTLPLLVTRRPEKYSSAAPLTADARQRIVCEIADFQDAVTVAVTVGPPGGPLKEVDPSQWKPKAVAEQVLVDRSTGRITTGQRVSLNSVDSVLEVEQQGVKYIIYDHVSQGSPTLRNPSQETYRHSYAVTAVRPGLEGTPYLYTLSLSCPQELWEELAGPFKQSVESFKLLPPGPDYVAPDKNPWLFF